MGAEACLTLSRSSMGLNLATFLAPEGVTVNIVSLNIHRLRAEGRVMYGLFIELC